MSSKKLSLKNAIELYPRLERISDLSIWPDINSKKIKNALKSYGDISLISKDILLLIDNTLFRSAKQGLFLTESHLFAYSAYSGKFQIKLDDIRTLKPNIFTIMKVPMLGIYINEEYFISLPGLNEMIKTEEGNQHAILVLTFFLSAFLSCEIIEE